MPKVGMGPIRRAQLFRAATEVIANESFGGATLKKVAAAAGVSTGTVNHYFANKSDLLIQTLKHIETEWERDVRNAVAGDSSGRTKIEAVVRAAGPLSTLNKLRWRVWTAAWGEAFRSDDMRSTLRETHANWRSTLADTFALIQPGHDGAVADLRTVARLYDALQNGLFLQVDISDGSRDDDAFKILVDFLTRCVGSADESSLDSIVALSVTSASAGKTTSRG